MGGQDMERNRGVTQPMAPFPSLDVNETGMGLCVLTVFL